MLRVHEIFTSIQGEGYDTGIPCTFVRLFGCNIKCTFCDQPQHKSEVRRMSVASVVDEVRKRRVKNVCITGGEPLIQEDVYSLIYELTSLDYHVSIETNGSIPIEDTEIRSYKYVMDIKCPSSGESKSNLFRNLEVLHRNDEVKFVIGNREDYEYMRAVLQKYHTKAKILVSPMFDLKSNKQTIGKDLVDWILEDRLDNVKVQIQLHKILLVK